MKKRITAVITASGFGRRMGGNKLLMDFNGKPLFQYVVDTVANYGFYDAMVVTAYDEIMGYACKVGINAVFNPYNAEGMAASVRLGAEYAKDCDGIMFFTADMPFISASEIDRLVSAFDEYGGIIVPNVNGIRRNPVVFSSEYKNDFLSLSGEQGGRIVMNNHKDRIYQVFFDDETPFCDIDTPEDLKKFKKVLTNDF